MILKPINTEKAVMIIEPLNTLTFVTEKRNTKKEIKKEIEEVFKVKVKSIKVIVKDNKKKIYVKLKPEFQAIDIATKLGII